MRIPLSARAALRLEGRGSLAFLQDGTEIFCGVSLGGGGCAVGVEGGTFGQITVLPASRSRCGSRDGGAAVRLDVRRRLTGSALGHIVSGEDQRGGAVRQTEDQTVRDDDGIYRSLQQHLDQQAVGFPSVKSGADIRLLRRLFTPEEARLALHLSCKPLPTDRVVTSAAADWPAGQVRTLLESMLQKGAIGWKRKDGADHWYVMPMVVGIYECQDGAPSPEFLKDADAYMRSLSFGKSFLSVQPSQMRTIPINRSVTVEHHVATYDQTRELLREARGPFVVLPCICRRSAAMRGSPCAKVTREETCLAFGDMAAMVLRRKHGREVAREEVLAILEANQEDGLVLQPANARKPEFICSCCGCCCGMLSIQKRLPHPSDFWSSSYLAAVSAEACTQCGTCVSRCQVNAVTLSGPSGEAVVNPSRCIGCGLCVPTCPSEAVRLVRKEAAKAPPEDEDALCDEILTNRKGALGQLRMLAKVALGMKQ